MARRLARGPDLVAALVAAVASPDSPVGEASPLDATALRRAEDQAGVALSPSMAALFQLDAGFMRREYQWFDDQGALLARPLADLVADHAGVLAEGFSDILSRFPAHALPLDAGSDSARFLYLGDPDLLGEFPVLAIDHDDLPWLGVEEPGFDVWLAKRLGVATAPTKADLEATHKRLFGRKAAWSLDEPLRKAPKPVAGAAPGSVSHPVPARPKPGRARKLTDKQLDKALAERAGDGNVARLATLIAEAKERGRPGSTLDTALVSAAQEGRDAALRMLLEAGASPNARDYYGQAISRAVSYHAPPSIVQILLAAGASPNAASVNGRTALFNALEQGATAIAHLLVEAGASVDHGDANDMRPLHVAAEYGTPDDVRKLLAAGADVNGGKHFRTPLLLATERGREEIVEALLAGGADTDRPSSYLGRTPLHAALENAHDAVAAQLIRAGASRTIRDERGLTADVLYGPAGEDAMALVLPEGTIDGEIRCTIDVFVLNPAGLHPTLVPGLAPAGWEVLAAEGIGGPRARLAVVVDATSIEARVGPQTLTATLRAEAVEPPLFELVARTLRSVRMSMRVTAIRFEPTSGPRLEGEAARAVLAAARMPERELEVPIEVGDGEPRVVFTLSSPRPAPGPGDASLARVGRAIAAFAAAAPLWGGGPPFPPVAQPQFHWAPKGEVSELAVGLHCYGSEGKPLPKLPWNVAPMVATLAAVSARLREDVRFVRVRLDVGKS
ncbi:MAG: ankyrin repeat domain-containing protein [Myxococcales bacterium]|nr:ankyrin repeat domain-containing protein [Myxococcales bacterium]